MSAAKTHGGEGEKQTSKSKPTVEMLNVDTMLHKYCGEFGRWQLKNFLLSNLSCILEAFHTMVMIFADREPPWKCLDKSECHVGAATATAKNVCGLKPGSWEWVGGNGSSTVAEWNLVCGDKYKVGLAQAIFFLGCIFGAGVFGRLSDSTFGRKRSLMVVCILNAIFGCLTAFSPSYCIYALLRFLTGVGTAGNALCAFVLSTEPIGPTKRGIAGMSTFYFFSGGIALLSGIAYKVQYSWRKLYIVSSIPSLFFVVFILPFISESPRWYLVHGNLNKAMELLNTIAESNRKHIPTGFSLSLDKEIKNDDVKQILHDPKRTEEYRSGRQIPGFGSDSALSDNNLLDVIRSPIARNRLILGMAISLMNAVVYYGLSLNVVNLETNLYVNVVLNAIMEMPAFFITATMLNKLGRRGLGIWTLWFSAVFCLMGSLIGGKWKLMKMVCGLMALSGMAGNYNLLSIYFLELFPTVVRNVALGSASQATHIGAILAPFVVLLGGNLTFLVFGICGIFGGMLSFFLPETLNRPLYDTLAGLEHGENANKPLNV